MSNFPDDGADIVIPTKRYRELLQAEKKLIALENAGVDNWEWNGDAMESLYDEENE